MPTILADRRSLATQFSTYVTAAVVAAHASGEQHGGFGASEVRFFFLLFTNFVEADSTRAGEELALTQARRLLQRLEGLGLAEACPAAQTLTRRRGGTYRLRARGLAALARRLADEAAQSFDEVLFTATFLSSYRSMILGRVSLSDAATLAPRLAPRAFLSRAARRWQGIVRGLDARCEGGRALAKDAMRLASTKNPRAAVKALNRPGAYRLQGVRGLSELLETLPDDVLAFELERGIGHRVAALFMPQAARARAELDILTALAAERSVLA